MPRKEIKPSENAEPTKAEQLMFVDRPVRRVDIVAEAGNAGEVRVGRLGTSVLSGAEIGFPLQPGDSYFFENVNLKWIYVAGDNDGDAVTYNVID